MKQSFFAVMFLLVSLLAGAQSYNDIKASQLPKPAQEYLKQNMPNADITRAVKIDDDGRISYAVVFENDRGQKHVLMFDKEGTFTGKGDKLMQGQGKAVQAQEAPQPGSTATPAATEGKKTYAITTEKLPGKAQSYIKTNYPKGEIVSASQFIENGVTFYQVHVKDGTKTHILTFNSKGSYLSKRYATK